MQRQPPNQTPARLGPPALVRLTGDDEARVPVPTCDNEGQILYRSPRVRVGRFERPPEDPRFRFSGVPGEHVLVFSQRSVQLQRMGEPPYVTDSMIVQLFNPDQIYFRHGLSELGERASWVGVDGELLGELAQEGGRQVGSARERLWTLPYVLCDGGSYLLQAELVALLERHPSADEALVERAVLDLTRSAIHQERRALNRAQERGWRESTQRRTRELVERARSLFVADPLDHPSSLEQLARRLVCSPSTLNRAFRQCLDISVHQYQLHRRLRDALTLLYSGAAEVGEVASRTGFPSHSHFTNSFRSKLGVTPSWATRRPSTARLERLLDRAPGTEPQGA